VLEASRARAGSEPALRLLVGGSLVIVGGLAWAWTVAMAAMPDCHRVALGDLLVMWTVMMAAMMFPAPIPAVLAYAGFARARGEHMLLATLAFVGGCLVVCEALRAPGSQIRTSPAWSGRWRSSSQARGTPWWCSTRPRSA
jgi:predicted metal-binding membrane protein